MTLKIPDAGELVILNQLRAQWGSALFIELYRNDYTPVDGTVLANLTVANYSGYAHQNATGWTAAATVSAVASTTADPKTFTVGAGGVGNSVYGYYVTDAGGALMWAERDANPPVGMNVNGDNYTVTAKFTFSTAA